MRVVQIPIHPTKGQASRWDAQLDESRHLYNAALDLKKSAYERDKTSVSCFDLIKSEIKKHKVLSNASSMQQTLRRLDKSYQAFFKRCKEGDTPGYPRFKNRDRFRTLEYTYGDGIRLRPEGLYLQNVGVVKCDALRLAGYTVKGCSVTRKGGKYVANFCVESPPGKSGKTGKSIGLDVGLKTFITTSEGEKFDSPKNLKGNLKSVQRLHRQLQRHPKGSRQREKSKRALNKCYGKISNKRKDFNHKLSRQIVNRYDVIALEDIVLEDLKTNIPNINRTYADVAIGQFRQFLTYKAENAGKVVIKVDPRNTTKECSACGNLVNKTLKEREHICSCGHRECRDINAAKNILRRGLASLGATPRSPRIHSGE